MSNNKEDDKEIKEIVNMLEQNGFKNKEIMEAITETGSKEFDVIVDHIVNKANTPNNNFKGPKQEKIEKEKKEEYNKVNKELAEEARKTILKEKLYKQRIVELLKQDRKQKLEDDAKDDAIIMNQQKEIVIANSDCQIKIWGPEGRSALLNFNKNDTLEDLYQAVENELNLSNFKLYKKNDDDAVPRSGKKISEYSGLYPRSVLFVEE